jgi:hypothetical protein
MIYLGLSGYVVMSISEIELMNLRDIAFEYLPKVKDSMQATTRLIHMNHKSYYLKLWSESIWRVNRSSTAIELASARLLKSISSYALYDENDPEQQFEESTPQDIYDLEINRIEQALIDLSQVTGQIIKLNRSIEISVDTLFPYPPKTHTEGFAVISKHAGEYIDLKGQLPSKLELWNYLLEKIPCPNKKNSIFYGKSMDQDAFRKSFESWSTPKRINRWIKPG